MNFLFLSIYVTVFVLNLEYIFSDMREKEREDLCILIHSNK